MSLGEATQGESQMRYMLLIYTSQEDGAGASSREHNATEYGHWAIMEEARHRGIL
jgi:hypothetical protein